jgi:hypothetical protein
MAMKTPKDAVCSGADDCTNARQQTRLATCCYCGRCVDCDLHADHAKDGGGMLAPSVEVCGDGDCINHINAIATLACSACGRCGNCTFHEDCSLGVS